MNRDRARSQPTVINLPIPGSQDGAVPKEDSVLNMHQRRLPRIGYIPHQLEVTYNE